jgi:hypothetical protein
MGQSRLNKKKLLQNTNAELDPVFWVSLDEARRAISDKYEFLADRYERRYRKSLAKQKF